MDAVPAERRRGRTPIRPSSSRRVLALSLIPRGGIAAMIASLGSCRVRRTSSSGYAVSFRARLIGKVTLIGLPFDENPRTCGAAEVPSPRGLRSESSNPYSEAARSLGPGLLATETSPAAGETMLAQTTRSTAASVDLHPSRWRRPRGHVSDPSHSRKKATPRFCTSTRIPICMTSPATASPTPVRSPASWKRSPVGRPVGWGSGRQPLTARRPPALSGDARDGRTAPARSRLQHAALHLVRHGRARPAFARRVASEPEGSTRTRLAVIGAIDVPIVGADVVESST